MRTPGYVSGVRFSKYLDDYEFNRALTLLFVVEAASFIIDGVGGETEESLMPVPCDTPIVRGAGSWLKLESSLLKI